MRLRNPWGSDEWQGDFGDDSDLWTDEIKEQVGYTDEEGGIFFLPEKDFLRCYDVSSISYYIDGHHSSVVRAYSAYMEEKYFTFEVEEELSDVSFGIIQLSDHFTFKFPGYCTSCKRVVVGRLREEDEDEYET